MRTGDVGAVTPFRYTRLVFALILAAALFGERPDAMTLAGAGLIVAAGLFGLTRRGLRGPLAGPKSAGGKGAMGHRGARNHGHSIEFYRISCLTEDCRQWLSRTLGPGARGRFPPCRQCRFRAFFAAPKRARSGCDLGTSGARRHNP